MPEDQTIPPRQPNTPRTFLKWLWDWGHVHTFLSGISVGICFMLLAKIV